RSHIRPSCSARVHKSQTRRTVVMSLSVDDVTELKKTLDEQGYVVVPRVVSREALAGLGRELLDAYEKFEKFRGGGTRAGHLNCFPGERARFIYDQLAEVGLVDAVWAARPDLIQTFRVTTNFNLPGSVAQHYHMDGLFSENFVICNVAIVDITVENGAMD